MKYVLTIAYLLQFLGLVGQEFKTLPVGRPTPHLETVDSKKLDTYGPDYKFYYSDLKNFRTLLKTAREGGDTLTAMKTYFSKGSEGMKAWIKRYDTQPEQMVKAITYLPKYYAYLSQMDTTLMKYEIQIADGLDGLKKLYPSPFVHIPPIYYFILFGGGGSIEMTANMISVDYFGYHEDMDKTEFNVVGGLMPNGNFPLAPVEMVPQVVIHETTHLLQTYMQGETNYVSIYKESVQMMIAYAIREGSAEFLAFLASGLLDTKRFAFGEENEKELWTLFEPLLYEKVDQNKGWFSGKSPEHPEWPWQIGYYVGFKMVEYYYKNAENKETAINFILNAHKMKDFEVFVKKYKEKWKD